MDVLPPAVIAPSRRAIEWAVAESGGGRPLSVERLRGGISHANHSIRIESPEGRREVVLRRWVRPDWRETDPEYTPEQEVATYGLLAASAVPAPRLLAADTAARECDVPAILLTRVVGAQPGRPADETAFLAGLAAVLPSIHAVDPGLARRTLPAFGPWYEVDRLRVPVWTERPKAWQAAFEAARRSRPDEPRTFIHRDYHPGNTLWAGGRLTAVVDWTTASFGPPSADLAHMRLNLAVLFGLESADRFLDAYRAVTGSVAELDPYWDLRDAVEFIGDLRPDAYSKAQLRRLDAFVVAALVRLEGPTR